MAELRPGINIYTQMFALRRITRSKLEHNFALGESYTVVDREKNPDEFQRTMSGDTPDPEKDDKDIFGFVIGHPSKMPQAIALYRGTDNYIMTERGSTFAYLKETV
jgi:hypothetical protein